MKCRTVKKITIIVYYNTSVFKDLITTSVKFGKQATKRSFPKNVMCAVYNFIYISFLWNVT